MAIAASASPLPAPVRNDTGVAVWLFVIAGMIAAMVLVGGLTRLTGSGLSITEWQPVTGMIPPLSEAAWQAEFAKYQGTPQYELINRELGLAGFQSIYWWEWTHRLLGRLIGIVFAIPFLFFLWQRRITRVLSLRLAIIFLFGGAQGVLGWWMVQSGLEPSRVAVSQYRLAAHLGLAILLFGYILWTALEVIGARRTNMAALARFKPWAAALVAFLFVQMLLGAFMAGLDAGRAFADWPTYGGAWVPPGLYDLSPWWINHFENPALVHFQHRTAGYAVAVLALWLSLSLGNAPAEKPVHIAGLHVLALTIVQIMLGIFTVTSRVALPIAALHQIGARLLFGASLWLAYALSRSR